MTGLFQKAQVVSLTADGCASRGNGSPCHSPPSHAQSLHLCRNGRRPFSKGGRRGDSAVFKAQFPSTGFCLGPVTQQALVTDHFRGKLEQAEEECTRR